MLLPVEPVVVNGLTYTHVLTDERQVVNGEEVLFVVDHEKHEVRWSVHITAVFRSAASVAAETSPDRSTAPGPLVVCDRRTGIWTVMSGCFPVKVRPWPWWKS